MDLRWIVDVVVAFISEKIKPSAYKTFACAATYFLKSTFFCWNASSFSSFSASVAAFDSSTRVSTSLLLLLISRPLCL